MNWNSRRLITVTSVMAYAVVLASLCLNADDSSRTPKLILNGVVKNADGAQFPNVLVRLERNGVTSGQAVTDAAGKFLISVSDAGVYVLRVSKPGFIEVNQTVSVTSINSQPCEVVLVPTVEKSARGLQMSDNPDFTIAGVTDWTAAGGHGSDVHLRTSEALAKDTRDLGSSGSNPGQAEKTTVAQLQRTRDEIQHMLAIKDNADLHRRLGDVDEQLNDSLAAVHEYERAAQLDPSEQNYFAWATELLLHRAIEPAFEVFATGSNSFPRSERMLAGAAATLYAKGLYPEAAERLCAALDLNPRDESLDLFLGKIVETVPQPLSCAEEKLARFSREYPGNGFATYYYALALWRRTGNADEAETRHIESLLANTIATDPKFAQAYVQLGVLYAASGELDNAISAYKNAISADPRLAEAHFRLGQAYKKSGELAKAQSEFGIYQEIEKNEAAAVEQQRREIQQFVVVFKDKPENVPAN